MILFRHELKRDWKSLVIWSCVIGGMTMLCLMLFPQLSQEADSVDAMMNSLGSFGAAFGMDRLHYGSIMGFYGIYGGCMIGIGGMFYSALLGTGMLAKEEKEHTAEFLFTHPVSRTWIFIWKWIAMLAQVLVLNAIILGFSLVSFAIIQETPQWKELWLFHLAQLLMQIELLGICYGISSFLRKGSLSIGISIATLLYFLGIFGNIAEQGDFVKYITPYAYADAAAIFSNGTLDMPLVLLGLGYGIAGLCLGYWRLMRKDILG